jgi:glucosamine kinase
MNVVLGIDGGGTNTRASIVQGERVLAHVQNGSIKRLRVGAEAAEANLRALLKEVFAKAGVAGVRAASVGVASASMPGVKEWITAVLLDFGAERTEVVGDEVIALDAAFRGGPGILQIAGTGSNTIGRAPDGTARAPAAGVRVSAMRVPATGSASTAFAAPSTPTIASSPRKFFRKLAKSGARRSWLT